MVDTFCYDVFKIQFKHSCHLLLHCWKATRKGLHCARRGSSSIFIARKFTTASVNSGPVWVTSTWINITDIAVLLTGFIWSVLLRHLTFIHQVLMFLGKNWRIFLHWDVFNSFNFKLWIGNLAGPNPSQSPSLSPMKSDKQGNYSLRRPPKLIIPQAVIRHWEKMSFCMHIDV